MVAQVAQIFRGGKHPRGLSELNPFLPRVSTTVMRLHVTVEDVSDVLE